MATPASTAPVGPDPRSTAPLSRGHKKRARTQRRLLDAAIEVIAERGEAFTVSDVTARAEVSNGTFYNYFADRGELLEAVVPDIVGSFTTRSDELVESEDPALRFATISAHALAVAHKGGPQIRAWLRLIAAPDVRVGADVFDHLRGDLEAGHRAGRFTTAPDDALVDLVVGALAMSTRRAVEADPPGDHAARVIAHLLVVLGLVPAEADRVAQHAVAAAGPSD